MKGQKIVLVRHAHRDKPVPDEDNGLSEKGRKQSQELLEAYKRGTLPKARQFWTSPKKRCQETLAPLAEAAGQMMRVEHLLDEQRHDETTSQFVKRIEKLLQKAADAEETVYLCSHGDLLPEAINLMTGKMVDVKKGQAIVVINEDENHWGLA